jgi:single-stranded-DNA-specific exonuclease
MMKWNIRQTPKQLVNEYQSKLQISERLASIIASRNMSIDTAKHILEDSYKIIDEPLPIQGIKEAVDFIVKYVIGEQRPVHVFADYDCDGLTSGYILKTFCELCQKTPQTTVYYPERDEGYGISEQYCNALVESYKDKTVKPVLITVDNGISKQKEIKILTDAGIPVLITDHHIPQYDIPQNCVIFDPHMNNDSLGHCLCGAGVIWNVLRYIEKKYCENTTITDYLIYAAAIGTIADMVPFDVYNIAMVKIGLDIMNSDKAPMNIKIYRDQYLSSPITAHTIAFQLGPMLNSCGRLGDVSLGAAFFYTDDEDDMMNILYKINECNDSRKSFVKEAKDELKTEKTEDEEICVYIANKWPVGIHGLIANDLVQTYNKPSFVFRKTKNNTYGGSCRSTTIPLNVLLNGEKEKGIIESFGGHAFAGGISIKRDKLEAFKKELNHRFQELRDSGKYDNYLKEKELNIDGYLNLEDINNTMRDEINRMPYDKNAFKSPVFILKNVCVHDIHNSKNNPENIRLTISDNTSKKSIWAWRYGTKYDQEIGDAEYIDIAGELVDDFQKRGRTTFQIIDIHKAG